MELVDCGLYTIKDRYFSDFKSDRHMHNKSEGRPYYLSIREHNGITWFIPISSKVDKYKAKIAQDEIKYGNCIYPPRSSNTRRRYAVRTKRNEIN